MRKYLSYANVISTLALVFAMAGGALAANHYLINSAKQINPAVLKKLKGATGRTGPKGDTGPVGQVGATGQEGPPGKRGESGSGAGYESSGELVGEIVNGTEFGALRNLSVPAGRYLINAKVWVSNRGAGRAEVACALSNNVTDDKDFSHATVEPIGTTPYKGQATLSLQAAATMGIDGVWTVSCLTHPGEVEVHDVSIQAVSVGSLSVTRDR